MHHKGNIGNAGFSIVEAMVAVVILSIIFIPITKCFISSIKASQETKIMQEATDIAQAIMEDCKEKSLFELYHVYNPSVEVDIESDVWEGISFEHEISREENECCDFLVDITLSKKPTEAETGGMEAINNYEMPKIYSMDAPSSYLLDIEAIPLWILNELSKAESLSIDTVKTKIQRQMDITFCSDGITGNTKIDCVVTYFYNGSAYKSISYGTVTLSEKLNNLYLYYIADYMGQTDILSIHNDDAIEANLYVMGSGVDSTVTNFGLRQENCTNFDKCKVISNVLISGTSTIPVSTQEEYVPVKEKKTRRYEIVVTVKKKSNGKVYSSMVSTRGE